MKRWSGMLAKERAKLSKLVVQLLRSKGAIPDDGAYQYSIQTVAGTLRLSFNFDTGAILSRFDLPERANERLPYAAKTLLNRYSGKWNQHWGRITADDAFRSFSSMLQLVLYGDVPVACKCEKPENICKRCGRQARIG